LQIKDNLASLEKNILITGAPGSGKTTVIEKLSQELEDKAVGFYTAEFRREGKRAGFELLSLKSNKREVLASVDYPLRYRVSRYGVKPEKLLPFLEELEEALASNTPRCLLLDEIGKMEFLSIRFKETVLHMLDSPFPVVATIMAKPHPFADRLKERKDVSLIEVTAENREALPRMLAKA